MRAHRQHLGAGPRGEAHHRHASLTASYHDFAGAASRLGAIGWVAAPEPGDPEARKYSFCYPSIAHRTHHLHVVETSSLGWPDWILFRDRLREHPDEAAAYGRLKRELAALDPSDRPRYRAAKAPFIAAVLAAARREGEGRGADDGNRTRVISLED